MNKKYRFIRYFIEICISFGIFVFFSLCLKDLFVPICYLLGYTHCIIMRIINTYLDLKFEIEGEKND